MWINICFPNNSASQLCYNNQLFTYESTQGLQGMEHTVTSRGEVLGTLREIIGNYVEVDLSRNSFDQIEHPCWGRADCTDWCGG